MESIFVAEMIGTMVMILLGNGVVANVVLNKTKGNNSGWMVITTGWAFAVFVGVLIAGPYSGAHLNPAVTIGTALAGRTPVADILPYLGGQFVGAFLGAFLVWLMYKKHFDITDNEDAKLGCFATDPAIRDTFTNMASEIIGTFVLVFCVFYISDAQVFGAPEGVRVGLGTVGALPIAIVVWVIGLSLGGTTGYAINPARDLAPRLMHTLLPIKGSSKWDYAYIPLIGPIVGSVLAALLFMAL